MQLPPDNQPMPKSIPKIGGRALPKTSEDRDLPAIPDTDTKTRGIFGGIFKRIFRGKSNKIKKPKENQPPTVQSENTKVKEKKSTKFIQNRVKMIRKIKIPKGNKTSAKTIRNKKVSSDSQTNIFVNPRILCYREPRYGKKEIIDAPFADKIDATVMNVINERDYSTELNEKRIEEKLEKEMEAAKVFQANQKGGKFKPVKKGKLPSFKIDSESSKTLSATGIANTQGRRKNNEDAHLATTLWLQIGGENIEAQLTGVFDGHGDDGKCSKFASKRISSVLGYHLANEGINGLSDKAVWNTLKLTMVDLSRMYNGSGGTTANVTLRIGENLWNANAGDSRAFLVDDKGKTIPLSVDQKPSDERLQKSIRKRKGLVFSGRIMGSGGGTMLGTPRSIGDHELVGAVTARPKITKYTIPPDTDTSKWKLVQCCDGVFDTGSSKQVGDLVHSLSIEGSKNDKIAKKIVHAALANGSRDNITAVVTSL